MRCTTTRTVDRPTDDKCDCMCVCVYDSDGCVWVCVVGCVCTSCAPSLSVSVVELVRFFFLSFCLLLLVSAWNLPATSLCRCKCMCIETRNANTHWHNARTKANEQTVPCDSTKTEGKHLMVTNLRTHTVHKYFYSCTNTRAHRRRPPNAMNERRKRVRKKEWKKKKIIYEIHTMELSLTWNYYKFSVRNFFVNFPKFSQFSIRFALTQYLNVGFEQIIPLFGWFYHEKIKRKIA